ncbi:Coiled-coil domain-containing protein 38, partial [Boothiomyces sp. JEL0866]
MKQHSLVFCPDCGSLLDQPSGEDDHVECYCCRTVVPASQFESVEIVTRSRPDVFLNKPKITAEGADRHKHLKEGATIQDKCPNCGHHEMVFHTAQLRSADEESDAISPFTKMSTQIKPPANKKMNAGPIAPKSISRMKITIVTPRSRILKLPEIHRSGTVGDLDNNQKKLEYENPFHMPTDVEVFALRENDRNLKRQQKQAMNNMSIYEKNSSKKKNFKALLAEDQDDIEFYKGIRKRDVDKVLAARQTRGKHLGKENLQDFIDKKREMFLVHYALGVKRDEMRKLETIAQREEQKLLDDEKALEEDAAKFDAFLKENDKNSVEAIKKAEMETKAKLEKIQEIKKLNVSIMSIRSDMTKNEDQLKDLQRYRQFLDKLTPAEFLATKKKENPKEDQGKMKKGGSQAKLVDSDDKKNL